MARYVTTVHSSLSVDEAFAYMADLTHFEAWDPGVARSVLVKGDGRSVGSMFDVTVNAGVRTVMRYEVMAFDPPRRVSFIAKTRTLESVDEVRIDAAADGRGALVTYDAILRLRGPLGIFDRALAMAFSRIGDRAAKGLRRVLGADRDAPR